MSEYPKIAGLLARASSNLRGSNKSWLGVLFENSIVCHVFYAIWFWGAVRLCGFLGLFVFGLPGSGFCLGLGWALVWFSGLCTDCCSGWLLFWGWLGFCWFCLESLILAQDERWRRA